MNQLHAVNKMGEKPMIKLIWIEVSIIECVSFHLKINNYKKKKEKKKKKRLKKLQDYQPMARKTLLNIEFLSNFFLFTSKVL